MIVFILHKNSQKYDTLYEPQIAETEVFNALDGYVDTETAIDASSWCTLATIGDEYLHTKFTIRCEEW